jgi:NAD/NADP transhydrogenase beta subunit
MSISLTTEQRSMVLASSYGLSTDQAEQFVADVTAELEALDVPVTRNHIRAATTKVLARGK